MAFRSCACALLLVACSWPRALKAQALDDVLSISRLPLLKPSKLIQVSSYDTSGGNADFMAIPRGETRTIASLQGPGVVVRIWVTISAADPLFLRKLLLRVHWDGEAEPSVEVPVGDFFGTGFAYRQWVTPLLGMSSGGYYAMFPMPFRQSARFDVVNQSDGDIRSLYYQIDYQRLQEPLPPATAYFHAQWRREIRTPRGEPYVVLDAEGEGHVVGVLMNMQSYDGTLSYLEGDERIFVDGEERPSIHGTGTEDYFTSGWYFNRGEYAAPTHGLILKDDSLGRIAAYRFHVGDAIPFRRSIRFTIEHGHANEEVADYASTVFWYQTEPHRRFAAILPAPQRIPLRVAVPNLALEAESLRPSGPLPAAIEDMTPFGPDWSGSRQLAVSASAPGQAFTVTIPGTEESAYTLQLYTTRGPDYADVEILAGDLLVGRFDGYAPEVSPGGRHVLERVVPSGSSIPLRFVVKGKDSRSSGYKIGLDAMVLQPVRRWIPAWSVIGPFPNPTDSTGRRTGLDTPFEPERSLNTAVPARGVDSREIRWETVRTPAGGYLDLAGRFEPGEHVVAYAVAFVRSPRALRTALLLGSDDGVKVFLNGREISRNLLVRVAQPDQERIPLELGPGMNVLLLKIENNLGGFGFYARVLDKEGVLKTSAHR